MKVGKFYFLVDFVILDMEEDIEILLFLKTSGALVDHKEDKLTLRVEDEKEVFNKLKATENPSLSQTCLRVDVVDPPKRKVFRRDILKEPPKKEDEW